MHIRRLTLPLLAAAAAVALTLGGAANAKDDQITVMTWGGHWLDIFKPVAKRYEEDTGIRVNFVVQAGASDGLNKLMAQRNNPQVDVWTGIESTVQAATQAGLLSKLDPQAIPTMADIPDDLKTETSVSIWLSPRGIFYRKDLVPFEIKEWKDLWDPRLKGLVGATLALDRGSFLILAALLNGGNENDIDKGFEKVRELIPNLHAVYNTDPESIKLLETGEIGVAAWGILPNVYRHLGPDSKYQFVMPAPRFLAPIPVTLVAGRSEEQTAAAAKFIDYMLSPQGQTEMTTIAGTIPSNPKAQPPEKLKSILPPLPISDIYNVDWSVVNANFSKWEDRWAQEIQVKH